MYMYSSLWIPTNVILYTNLYIYTIGTYTHAQAHVHICICFMDDSIWQTAASAWGRGCQRTEGSEVHLQELKQ